MALNLVKGAARSVTRSVIVKNGLFGWAGLAVSTGPILVLTPVLLRDLGYERFGVWTLATSMIGIAGFLENGLGTASARLLAKHHAAGESAALSEIATMSVVFALALGILLSGVLFLSAHGLAANFLASVHSMSATQMVTVIQIASVGLAGVLLRGGALAVPMGFQRYDIVASVAALQSGLIWVSATLVTELGGGIDKVVMSSVVAIWLTVFISMAIGLRMLHPTGFKPRLSSKFASTLIAYSTITSISSIGSQVFSSLDKVVVGAVLGVQTLAYYAILTNIALRLNQLAGLLWQGLMPVASVLSSEGATPTLWRYFVRATLSAAVINTSFAVALLVLADPLLTLWLGRGFEEVASWPLRILIVIYATFSLNAPSYHIANGIGAAWICAASGLLGGALTIFLIVFLGIPFGLQGAAAANAGYLVTLLIIAEVFRRLRPSNKKSAR